MTILVHSNSELRTALNGLSNNICLVPTMGALHDGHASLIQLAKKYVGSTGCVIVSDFVNPKQFGVNEDFEKYPRNLDSDLIVAQNAGANILWAPDVKDVYPGQWPLEVETDLRFEILEGKNRPGHFSAVIEVVTRLFDIVQPNAAVFGEKDFQQLILIKEMANKRNPKIGIIAGPTKRDKDELALSSRNVYLSSDQRNAAALIPQALKLAIKESKNGASVEMLKSVIKNKLKESDLIEIDYVEILGNDLNAIGLNGNARIFIAVKLGDTRLIDNMSVQLKGNL